MSINNELVNKIVTVLDKKKAENISVLYVGELTTITDYFVIASANSPLQAKALSDNLEERLIEDGIKPTSLEGYKNAEWVLLGFDDVVVHIFLRDARDFYSLERIWKDAPEMDISDLLTD